jgi:hypothetical protein
MSTDNMVDDGETTFYRVRIRFATFGDGESWGKWQRSSYAAMNYAEREDAERAAFDAWRRWDSSDDRRDIQVEVVEVYMTISPVARIEPATVDRLDHE